MSRRRRGGLIVAVVVLLIIASLILGSAILVYRPLPTTDGEYRLLGLEQRAEVVRDSYGVPHIYAQNAHDLFYLQGYVTAQDRLFQIDLYRRAGAGRLAEVLGEPGLESDRMMRTLGLARVAARELAIVRDSTRAMLSAYADGVNKFLEQHGEALPLEFVLLGYRPQLWSAVDSLIVAKLQVYDAANNYTQELLRANLALRFGTAALATLMPDPATRTAAVDENAWAAVAPMLSAATTVPGVAALRRALPAAPDAAGSNCWALAGTRTASGKPILAGDPHLAVRNPSIWYEVGLEGAGVKVIGFSFPGIPSVVIGHNERIAWSFTYAYADTQDLFVERQAAGDLRRFEHRGSFEEATFVRETIAVKGRADPVSVDVAITRHGPVITPILPDENAQLALRWTALEPGHLLDFIFDLARAANWSDFRAAAAEFSGAAISACYADVEGHVGYQLVGQLPARRGDGRMPVPGWTGEYDWTGTLPADANPSVFDPPTGVVINANDRPSGDPASPGYVGEWDPGFRATVLSQRLSGIQRTDLAAMRAIQTEVTSLPVTRFRETILSARPTTRLARDAQATVRAWDGTLSTDSAGAAIYESWLVRMCERVFKDKLGDQLYAEYAEASRATFALYELVARPDDAWFLEFGDPGVRGRDALAGRALDDAVMDLAAKAGDDPRGWRWGDLHTITFAHPLAIGPLGLLLNIGPLKRPGDGYSVNNQGFTLSEPFAVTSHPSERMIADLADLDASLSITPEGQSGQPGSRFWGDQTRLWANNEYKAMRFSRERLGAEGTLLTLVFRAR
jgi:penicillin G amidase